MDDFELGETLINLDNPKKQKISSSSYLKWENMGLQMGDNGYPRANEHNAYIVIMNHPELHNIAWYDEFHKKIFRIDGDTKREWGDHDDVNLTRFIQGIVGVHSLKLTTVRSAFLEFCQVQKRNEPKMWMESLQWDGEERLPMFMADCMGANENEYIRAVSQNLWIAMVARIYRPGCKYDNMIVLIGKQGTFKSTALSIIGGQWFAEVCESITTNNFFMALHGKLMIEIAELDSFNRAETTRIKAVASNPIDRYRSPYERAAKDHPRSCVFVGTTNEEQFLRDYTGGRRFWPVKVGQIRLDIIRDNRNQYFAEAVHKFKAGVTWHNVPEIATEEQEACRITDEWETLIAQYAHQLEQVTVTEVLLNACKVDIGRQTKADQWRAGQILRHAGWERRQVRDHGVRVWAWHKKEET